MELTLKEKYLLMEALAAAEETYDCKIENKFTDEENEKLDSKMPEEDLLAEELDVQLTNVFEKLGRSILEEINNG